MRNINELLDLHRRSLGLCTDVAARAETADPALPTPCSGWDLRRLLAHMTGQNHGFAAAVERATAGSSAGLDAFTDRAPEPGGFAVSAGRVIAAFAAAPPELRVPLAEFTRAPAFPLGAVVGFHLLDSLAHAWDVSAALGEPVHPAAELAAAGLEQALLVPDTARENPGSPFAPALPAPEGGDDGDDADDGDDWARMLLVLGRDPEWVPYSGRATTGPTLSTPAGS